LKHAAAGACVDNLCRLELLEDTTQVRPTDIDTLGILHGENETT